MKKNVRLIISALLTVVLIILYFVAPFEGIDATGKGCLLVFFWAIVLWIIRPIPEYLTAIISAVLMSVLFGIGKNNITASFGGSGWWMILFAVVMGAVVDAIGLGRRFAYWMVSRFCNTYKKTLWITNLVNDFMALFVSSGTARGALMTPIIDSICDSLGYKPGEYKGDEALVVSQIYSGGTQLGWIYTGSGATIIGMTAVAEFTGQGISWLGWFKITWLPFTAMLLLIPLVTWFLFKPKDGNRKVDNTFAKEELEKMGPMLPREKRAIVILALTLLAWLTDDIHGVSSEVVLYICGFLLLCPGIGCISMKEIRGKMAWESVIWLGFAMSIASIVNSSGGFEWIVNKIFLTGDFFTSLSFMQFMLIWIPFVIFSHIIFAGVNAMVTIFAPVSLTLAAALGFNPYTVGVLTTAACCCCSNFLPFNSAPNMIYYGTGRFTVGQQLKGAVVMNIIMIALMLVTLVTYWPLIGIAG